ncbi:hypothetical protein [Streptomyces acidicola]
MAFGIVVSTLRVRRALMSSSARIAIAAPNMCAEIEAFPTDRPALPRA